MTVLDKLNKYFELQKEILDYFGFPATWKEIPIDDATQYYWRVTDDEDEVKYCEEDNLEEARRLLKDEDDEEWYKLHGDKLYSNEIYTYCHLDKYIYRTADYTMICVDTHCDGNKFLQIFDNAKEIK